MRGDLDEKQAIRQLKEGDISGLEFLVNRHQVKAVHTAYLITRDVALAEDVVQESFLSAYGAIRSFDAARPFGPWFMRSVVNGSVKAMQKARRQVPIEDETQVRAVSQLAAQMETVESQVESAEAERQIWEAMQKLSPRQRAVIVQRYFLEMSEREMAEGSETAVGTIKWLLNAARERLRTLLAERSDE